MLVFVGNHSTRPSIVDGHKNGIVGMQILLTRLTDLTCLNFGMPRSSL